METKIFNIDSINRNLTKYPNSSNFTYNTMDTIDNTTARVIPFNEKNVIGIKILSIEVPNTMYYINATCGNNTFSVDGTPYIVPSGSYTIADLITTLNSLVIILQFSIVEYEGKVVILSNDPSNHTLVFPSITTGYQSFGQLLGFINNTYIVTPTDETGENALIIPQVQYFFLRLNDLGNIINNNTNYVAKLLLSKTAQNSSTISLAAYDYISNPINLDQPQDIKELKISLEDRLGNIIDLNGSNFSFTLELTIITNAILKNYDQIKFYSEPVMQRLLQSKMLAYFEKKVSKDVNDSLTGTYNTNLSNLNNQMEYNPFGNRNDYNTNLQLSYFHNMEINK